MCIWEFLKVVFCRSIYSVAIDRYTSSIILQEESLIHGSPNEIVSGTPPLEHPKTNEEVKWRQMDIIYFLAQHGVPAAEKDSTGQTPSDKAMMLDEINFMEGAVLLGTCSYFFVL